MVNMKNLHNYLNSQHGILRTNLLKACIETHCEPWLDRTDWVTVGSYLGISNNAAQKRWNSLLRRLKTLNFGLDDVLYLTDNLDYVEEDHSGHTTTLSEKRRKESTWTMFNGEAGNSEAVTYQESLPDNIDEEYLLSQAGLTTEEFKIETVKVSNWGDNQKAVSATFRRKQFEENFTSGEVAELIGKAVNEVNIPQYRRPVVTNTDLVIVNWYDAHFGKLAYDEHFNLFFEKRDEIIEAVREHLSLLKPKKIVLPVGNDFFNVDNAQKTTTKGTPQDNMPWRLMVEHGVKSYSMFVDAVASYGVETEIIGVEGNHDLFSTHWLMEVFKQRYKSSLIKVKKAAPFNFYNAQNLSFMFVHEGKDDTLRDLFAAENPEGFVKKYKEVHKGHYHVAKVEYKGGICFRTMGSTSVTDSWHYENFHTTPTKVVTTLGYSEENGYKREFSHNI